MAMSEEEYTEYRRKAKEEWQDLKDASYQYIQLPYEAKLGLAETRVWEWRDTCRANGKDVCVSVGGLDSIVLLLFVRKILGDDVVGASVSHLEDKSVQAVHKQLGVECIKSGMPMVKVLQDYGFPIYSKQISGKIGSLQIKRADADERKTFYNHALMTGETGPWGHFKNSDQMRMDDDILEKFGGEWKEDRPDLDCRCSPFKVSNQCCYIMKELPARKWQEEHEMWPFLGLMQSEGGQRKFSLIKHGCNYVGKTSQRSCPFNYFTRQDLLQLALDLNAPVPEIYGEIVRDADGKLRTTKAQRTGCVMCGYGIHLDARPHHFDYLRERSEKEWNFWMYSCCTDENGEKYGWGRVLDYIGVPWENYWDNPLVGQQSLFGGA